MRMGHIYSLSDPDTGEVRYIGKTILKPSSRLKCHINAAKNGGNNYVHRWIRTLSKPPQMTIICDAPESNLNNLEIYWIATMKSAGARLTNLTRGGDGPIGYRHSAEALARISASGRGKPKSAEHRAKISTSLIGKTTGRKMSAETRVKLSAIHADKKLSDKHKAKISAGLKGRKFSSEHRQHISDANRGRQLSTKTRAKISEALRGKPSKNRGRHHTPETKAKISASQLGKVMAPETRAKISASLTGKTGRKTSDSTKAKISASLINRKSEKSEAFKAAQSKIHECKRCGIVTTKTWIKRHKCTASESMPETIQ
jgi:NUMOD3 motif